MPDLGPAKSFYLLSLGCPKNEVDAECMSALLKAEGFVFEREPSRADYLVVNTCAFIQPAAEEAIDAILDLARHKSAGGGKKYLVVTGCLAQRYGGDICREMPEVDAVLGTGEYKEIARVLRRLGRGDDLSRHAPGSPGDLSHLCCERIPSAARGTYAYVKIAEGCSNACSYCAIPSIRGRQRSREPQAIIDECGRLVEQGVKELILVAQDTTRYGNDLPSRPTLAELLRDLSVHVPKAELIRCLYFYADRLTDALIGEMAVNPKAAHYLDLPIQHASDRVLKRMRRHETAAVIESRIARVREWIPDVILRTTVMVGFPGETDEDFEKLLDFIGKIRFDRLGCFVFYPEEGTRAAELPDQVPAEIARARREAVMKLQQQISLERNRARIGQEIPVLLEGFDERGILFQGRSYGEAPDIDPVLYVAATSPDFCVGSRPVVRIVDAGVYDLTGVTVDEYRE